MSLAKNIFTKLTPELGLYFCVTALFFVTPISSSAKSIFLIACIAIVIFTPNYRQELISLLARKYFLTALLLFFIAAIACAWSPASWPEKGLVLEKWSKLLYLPCLIVCLKNQKLRRMAINAFICAMVFTCFCSLYFKFSGAPLPNKVEIDGVFRNHIMTGIMMSFAAYLAGINFLKSKNTSRLLYLTTFLLTSAHVLFINEGRTGYVIYVLLIGLLIIQNCNKSKALLGLTAMSIILAGSCYLSDSLWSRVKLIHTDLTTYEADKNTSIGYRIQFHDFAKQIFTNNPKLGSGTGSFTYKFRTEDPVPAWSHSPYHSGKLLEPHSQYWLVAAEFGILGIIAFLIFYLELLYRTYQLEHMRPIALALFLILTAGNFTDSLLFYSGSGYFFILFFALAFSEKADSEAIIKSLQSSINKRDKSGLLIKS